MKIHFSGKATHNYVMINTLKVRLKSGTILTLDRNETSFSYDCASRKYSMDWYRVYIWAIDSLNIFGDWGYHFTQSSLEDLQKLLKESECWFELEDDVPDADYAISIEHIDVC